MVRAGSVAIALCLLQGALAVKVKVVMRSDEDSAPEEEQTPASARAESWPRPRDVTMLPFVTRHEARARPLHPNDMLFPLVYRQSHVNSMFKFGENWYTWSVEKRSDGSKAVSYYICYDEPKRCDDVGWERTDSVPRCAFQIESVTAADRACVSAFGVEPRAACDAADQVKISEIVKSCGPRIRSLWRFARAGRRPPAAAKPADVNSLVCEDEDECFLTLEYRIHHDRITFSLHEPSRGQTFKSMLKRELTEDSTTEGPHAARTGTHAGRGGSHGGKHRRGRGKPHAEGKGVLKERNDSGYAERRPKNKIKIREDISEDLSE